MTHIPAALAPGGEPIGAGSLDLIEATKQPSTDPSRFNTSENIVVKELGTEGLSVVRETNRVSPRDVALAIRDGLSRAQLETKFGFALPGPSVEQFEKETGVEIENQTVVSSKREIRKTADLTPRQREIEADTAIPREGLPGLLEGAENIIEDPNSVFNPVSNPNAPGPRESGIPSPSPPRVRRIVENIQLPSLDREGDGFGIQAAGLAVLGFVALILLINR